MRVLVLMHCDLVPPKNKSQVPVKCKTEADVMTGLSELGHEVRAVGICNSLTALKNEIETWRPHIVFNLLEEFSGSSEFESHVVSYLEMHGVAYTGCNAKGLQVAKDKALTKVVLGHYGLSTPRFVVVRRGQRFSPNRINLKYPLIVKARNEEASRGIACKSVVVNSKQLLSQIERMHSEVESDALIEEYINGREFYLGLIGHRRLQTLPLWELDFGKLPKSCPRIATERLKWNEKFQKNILLIRGPRGLCRTV